MPVNYLEEIQNILTDYHYNLSIDYNGIILKFTLTVLEPEPNTFTAQSIKALYTKIYHEYT